MCPIIEIENLCFSYPDGRPALNGIDLNVRAGEKVAVVGPNGAGKSTLFLHLNGILSGSPSHGAGRVCVAGIEVNERTARKVRAQVGLVFQNPDDQLFSTTVFEDVAFGPLHMGLPAADVRVRVERALSAVAMRGYEARMPHHLSLGERKRIAIATVLSMEPDILALDEPSAGLDPRARRSLIALLRSLPQTMLIATHDMRLVWELCPRTVVLDGGRVAADGATSELLRDESLMEQHGLETPLEAVAPAMMAVC
ncbi:MAG: ATP-binding cassette domain-containing protein [Anaerolineae bacterium]|nr:ATP-binding cassette domain-containing protein [Anaerolineae bacterium]